MPSYIGLISGTSMDGIDAVVASFDLSGVEVHAKATVPYASRLRESLHRAIDPLARLSLDEFASLHVQVGRSFAAAANEVLAVSGLRPIDVCAIGSHGQTLRHSPQSDPPYTLQLGDAATIATRCGIATVADFRSLDVAAGGQGAPLVPAFHAAFLRDSKQDVIVLNIGGIANITTLAADRSIPISGFDTGPGNCLSDDWTRRHHHKPYDEGGRWASSGVVSKSLLKTLLSDPYVILPAPKSTGREYFNLDLLERALVTGGCEGLDAADIQATLLEFTAASVALGIQQSGLDPARVLVCGGGAHNPDLVGRLQASLKNVQVCSTASLGIDPDFVEALAFAWLAQQRIACLPVQLTTGGAMTARILGAVYLPS